MSVTAPTSDCGAPMMVSAWASTSAPSMTVAIAPNTRAEVKKARPTLHKVSSPQQKPVMIAATTPREIGRAHVALQSLMRISYAVFCLKKKKHNPQMHANETEKETGAKPKHVHTLES